MMGNSTSYHRHYFYWGAVFLLMIPSPSGVNGWNIPYFGSGANGPSSSSPAADDPGVRVDTSTPAPFPALRPEGPASIPLLSTVAAPLIGPADAPHLRYIPSYFSNQIPPKIKQLWPTILSTFHTARLKIFRFLWYKPPLGIVGAWSFLRVLEKVYGVISPPPPTSGDEALAEAEGKLGRTIKALMPSNMPSKLSPWGNIGRVYSANVHNQQILRRRRKRRSKVRKGRSFDLDRGDQSYANFGGIETVRVRACQEGLRSALEASAEIESLSLTANVSNSDSRGSSLFGVKRNKNDNENVLDDESMAEYENDMKTALSALRLNCPPKGSREYFVEQSSTALAVLGKYIPSSKSKDSLAMASIHEQNINLLLNYSSKLIELRTLDALLRTLRDRHLVVSARLRRTRNYWKWHVNLSGGSLGRLVQTVRQKTMSVFPALMVNDFRDINQREYELAMATLEQELGWLGKVEILLLERPTEMDVGDLLAVVGNKKKPISLWGNFVNSEETDASSKPSMSESIQLVLHSKNRMWARQTEEWNKMARETIKDSLDETISASSFTPLRESGELDEMQNEIEKSNIYAESRFLKKWAYYDDSTSDANSWLAVLSLVEYAASPTRAGERRQFQFSSLTARVRRYDFLGIPSSVLLLAAANSLHDKVIAPHTQEIVEFGKSIFNAIWGVIQFRFYTPMKDIVLDLLNRRPRMVDPFALLNEQTSLDNMLKDLGVGDGTRQARAAALAAASRMYEQEVSGGAIRGIFRGKVAQLMLIQIQQLKADLLQAMDQIDNLVDANRLNVQLVASIPAVLILIFGTRAIFLFWSNIRMKDFRLPHAVHADMSDYLKKIEECLILSNYQLDTNASTTVVEEGQAPIARAEACLKPKEMGQLLLLLHAYLNLLDYMSPPFPSKQCDSIHQSVQSLLMQGQMSTSRQLELLKVIQSKHVELLKSL